jgi:hypothetical protein
MTITRGSALVACTMKLEATIRSKKGRHKLSRSLSFQEPSSSLAKFCSFSKMQMRLMIGSTLSSYNSKKGSGVPSR